VGFKFLQPEPAAARRCRSPRALTFWVRMANAAGAPLIPARRGVCATDSLVAPSRVTARARIKLLQLAPAAARRGLSLRAMTFGARVANAAMGV